MSARGRLAVLRQHSGICQLPLLQHSKRMYRVAQCVDLRKPLVVTERHTEELASNEILIKTKACGLNYATYLQTRGEYQVKLEPPFIPGNEIAGEVLEVGDGVNCLSPGDVVIGLLENGGLQEMVTVPDYMVDFGAVRKIDVGHDKLSIDYSKLAGVMVNYGTAWMALTRKGQIRPGQTVLITGASGGVGLAAVELASRVFNCKVLAVCRAMKSEIVKSYGAEHTIDYTSENLRQAMKNLAPFGVDIVFDAVGGAGAVDLVKSLAFEGKYITIGYTAGIPKIPANILLLKSASAVGLWWGNTMQRAPDLFNESVDVVTKLYLEGKISPYIQETLPLDKVNEAFEKFSSRQVAGKLVIGM